MRLASIIRAPHYDPSIWSMASSRTSHPAARSSGVAFRVSAWLMPFSHGTKIIPAGAVRADPDVPLGPGNKPYIIDFQEYFGAFPGAVRRAGLPPCRGTPVVAIVRAARCNLAALEWIFGRLVQLMSRLIFFDLDLEVPVSILKTCLCHERGFTIPTSDLP